MRAVPETPGLKDTARRVAVLSVHTSPLAQPGTGDAGGMNVYVLQTALELARRGVEVEIFTRATSSADAPLVQVAPGVLVRNVVAGPSRARQARSAHPAVRVHRGRPARRGHSRTRLLRHRAFALLALGSGRLAGRRPLGGAAGAHRAHPRRGEECRTRRGRRPEPALRSVGEQQVVDEADRLIVNTELEAQQLVSLHHAERGRIDVVHPGVDLQVFTPGSKLDARAALGLAPHEQVVAFIGRIQPLKAPDVLLRAVAKLPDVRVVIAGGPSGSGLAAPDSLVRLADELGISSRVSFLPPQSREELVNVYRAADIVAVPSYSESFGLVAVEAQACGTPVVAASVGGLPVAVRDGVSGTLVDGHDAGDWSQAIGALFERGPETMSAAAVAHAATFSWAHTVDALLDSYTHAITDYRARHPRREPTGRRGRRFALRRGVRA